MVEAARWPRGLSAGEAAEYVGLSRTNFLAGVKAQRWPQPLKIGHRVVWDRALLDRRLDEMSGIAEPSTRSRIAEKIAARGESRV